MSHIARAAHVLRSGGLVAFPTETVYGLGADAENQSAVERVFKVKGRPATHPLIVHVHSIEELAPWVAEVPFVARALAERFWPGPLSLVLRRSKRVSLAVTGGLETVAVRVPAHPTALALLRAFGGALVGPSANRFGAVSPTTASHVRDDLGSDIELVVDGGPCAVGVESTIVDATGDEPCILRSGGVTREDLEHALGHTIPMRTSAGGVRAPGSHSSHYAPRAAVILVDRIDLVDELRRHEARGQQVGLLLPHDFEADPDALVARVGAVSVRRAPKSLAEYARTLYSLLRDFDLDGCELILASLPSQQGLGVAIADRLRRAAAPRPVPIAAAARIDARAVRWRRRWM